MALTSFSNTRRKIVRNISIWKTNRAHLMVILFLFWTMVLYFKGFIIMVVVAVRGISYRQMEILILVLSRRDLNMDLELSIGLLINKSMLETGTQDCLMAQVFISVRIDMRDSL